MEEKVLYHSNEFTMFSDKLRQGQFESVAHSPRSIVSNYGKLAENAHPRGLQFKFSINGGDNELPIYEHHYLVLYPEKGYVESPLIRFGEQYHQAPDPEKDFLEADTFLTIRLDMRPVVQAFEEQGYYEVWNGERIYKDNFTGVFIAGDAPPLCWDFENLPQQEGVRLEDKTGEGIYEVVIHLNKSQSAEGTERQWQLKEDVSSLPQYHSPHLLIDALYNLSLEEVKLNIRPDNTFMAGEEWFGVWTRDISYSILLSLAAIEPEISKKSLMQKVEQEKIIQDTGTGGSWPVSTDRVTWALAAWEVFKVTGEEDWLKRSFAIIRNTVEDDLKVAFDARNGLFYGESSFLDWREQTYPAWMDSADIYKSQCLGTNAVHYQTYRILVQMGEMLGEPVEKYKEIAHKLKDNMNKYLWNAEKGYYGQFLYGRYFSSLSPRAEALGEALTVLFDIAEGERQEKVVCNSPNVPFGAPSIYPQISGIPPYHNNSIWPFVQAYWNWAAAKAGNEQALLHGLAALYRQAALFLTNKENLVAETGDDSGTVINSNRQLWSVAGNLAMVYRVFYGMHFEPDGLIFKPFVPEAYNGVRQLSNFRYRASELNILLKGWGSGVKEILLDGELLPAPKLPSDMSGKHKIEIILNEQQGDDKPFSLLPNYFSPETPQPEYREEVLRWDAVDGAAKYQIWCNGVKVTETRKTDFSPDHNQGYAEYQIAAVDGRGCTSFLSQPVLLTSNTKVYVFEMEHFVQQFSCRCDGFNGKGYVHITKEINTRLQLSVKVEEAGTYLLDFRYSNGNGPVHTDNKAAIRSLLKGEDYIAAVVFPQRGEGEWSNWGWSNVVEVALEEGANLLTLALEPCSENMNKEVNSAILDQIRLMKFQ